MADQAKVLNQQQFRAIKYGKGPLLIIAGAGTGKTTVITERIKYLISKDLTKPSEILALTFTEKAALEMEQRVDEIMPYGFTQMWISTFHAFCDRILRDEALHIGLDYNFTLMTEAETIMFLKKHLFELKLDYFRPAGNPIKFLNGLIQHFSRLKDEDISANEYIHWAQVQSEETKKNLELANAYQKYEQLKIKEGVMDFADLISNTLRLFRTRKNILKNYQEKFKFILVDEFQDTNVAQYELVKLLGYPKKAPNLCVVGDDSQSIYKFRGAAVSNILSFMKDYPKAKQITLTTNYRSTQIILDKAYQLIKENNPDTLESKLGINKNLVSAKKIKGQAIELLFSERVETEAEQVAKEIKKLKEKYQYGDIAILVRANNHADPFISAFNRLGIPYQFLGPGRLLRQEEVKDLIAYLKVLYNLEDNIAFFRVLSLPIFDISARDIAAIRNYAKRNNISMFEAAEKVDDLNLSAESKEKISKVIQMIHRHLELIPKNSAGQILFYFLTDSGLIKQISEYKTEAAENRANNISKFFNKLKTYESEHEDNSVFSVVDWLDLKMAMGESPLATDTDWTIENKVNILTVHSSKGLEFPVVFLVNLVSERFPTRQRREQIPIPDDLIKEVLPEGDPHLQEERRLFYVGMTRAKDLLYFTASKFYGEAKRIKKISPFVFEALGEKAISSMGRSTLSRNNQLSIFDFGPTKEQSAIEPKQSAYRLSYVSYSQIDTFLRCPLQYRYKYILAIPAPPHSSASFGSSIHAVLRDFYRQLKSGGKQGKESLLSLLKHNWVNLGYENKEHERHNYKLAKKLLLNFYDKFFNPEVIPQYLEQNFKFSLRPGLILGGKIDRIDGVGVDEVEILDYKTSDALPDQKEVDKDLQLTLYALAICQKHFLAKNPKEVTLSLLFLKQGKKLSTHRSTGDLERAHKKLLKTIGEIEGSDFIPTPGYVCNFCEYKLLCPVWV